MSGDKQSAIVAEWRERTAGLFHEINGITPADIEDIARLHIQHKLSEYNFDAEISDLVVSGSRARGTENSSSDIDIVVEMNTPSEREDTMFNAFNEDHFKIEGIPVDINPIISQKTGTLGEYLQEILWHEMPVSLFSIIQRGEEAFFRNRTRLDADGLIHFFACCVNSFVEMNKCGESLDLVIYSELSQQQNFSFSVDFDIDEDAIRIFDGQKCIYQNLPRRWITERKSCSLAKIQL